MTKQVYAYLNHGRWLAACPIHEFGNKLEVKPGEMFISPCCYPDIIAVIRMKDGSFRPDNGRRKTARLLAEKAGDVYEVVFPSEFNEIQETVKDRPKHNRNWTPGESPKFLRKENREHGNEIEQHQREQLAELAAKGDQVALRQIENLIAQGRMKPPKEVE